MLKKLKIHKLIVKLKIRENQHMPYKKKFKLPGPFWDTFIKKKIFGDIFRNTWTGLGHIYKKNFLSNYKKKFLETIKKFSSKL